MEGNFEEAIGFILTVEGGLSNDPDDPGGMTKFGISSAAYPDIDIESLTLDEAKEIYRRDYWDKMGCDNLPQPLDVVVMDAAVNNGPHLAKSWLNDCMGDWCAFNLLRMERFVELAMKSTSPNRKYFFGWCNRIRLLDKLARKLEKNGNE